ncbi:hypothetical protein RA307_04885 [Xanthobacteraceae bacterium Astr-EGSB]|uniref:hypothetical protein n=1 Tax=Astrobacterium formosum TaxID=3069710 RepID=UPI0027B56AA7|nr:hypothetical protein [Xanthobacteraceae bacterium Astr-EGSB]
MKRAFKIAGYVALAALGGLVALVAIGEYPQIGTVAIFGGGAVAALWMAGRAVDNAIDRRTSDMAIKISSLERLSEQQHVRIAALERRTGELERLNRM